MKDTVSVIIPFYNGDYDLLRRALDSVFASSYQYVEIVIVNDGSDISLPSEIYEHENVIVLNNKKNRGISYARNEGVKHCAGKWVMWLDHDDYINVNCISDLLFSNQRKTLTIGSCMVYEENEIDKKCADVFFELAREYERTIYDPFMLNIFSIQPQLVLREAVLDIGGFREEFRYAELTEFFLRFLSVYGIAEVGIEKTAIYNYDRSRQSSISKNRNTLQKYRIKALKNYAVECGIDIDDILYLGRCRNLETQAYVPQKGNEVYMPPYFSIDNGVVRIGEEQCKVK